MKLKKALKLMKSSCSDDRCVVGICPLAFRNKDFTDCALSMDNIDNWDIPDINKRCKRLKKEAKGGKHDN